MKYVHSQHSDYTEYTSKSWKMGRFLDNEE